MDCPLSFHDSEEENYDAENQENSNPNIFNVDRIYRNRDRGLRGKAFRFNGKVNGFTFSDNSRHGRIREFNTKLGDRLLSTMQDQEPLKWISYVVFSYEIGHLSSCTEIAELRLNNSCKRQEIFRLPNQRKYCHNFLYYHDYLDMIFLS